MLIYLLRKENREIADDMLEYIQSCPAKQMEFEMEKAVEQLKQVADLVEDCELPEAKRYLRFTYSPIAHAVRNGEIKPYNGEVYLTSCFVCNGKLCQHTATVPSEIWMKEKMLLIEQD